MEEKRYRILRFIAGLIEATGWIVAVAGPVFMIPATAAFYSQLPRSVKFPGYEVYLTIALGSILFILAGFVEIAFAQLIRIFIEIEANTRSAAETIAGLRRSLRAGSAGTGAGGHEVFNLP